MKMKRFFIWQVMAIPLLLCSCSENEEEEKYHDPTQAIVFNAGIKVPTGSTTEEEKNEWQKIHDRRVGIEWDGIVKQYMADENGKLTSTDPFYWDNRESASVHVWYPYNNGEKPGEIVVKANQSLSPYYWASNVMGASNATVSVGNTAIELEHLTAKVVCTLNMKEGADQAADYLAGARITLCHLQGVEEGNSIRMTADHKAFVAPQTLSSGTEFVSVSLPDGHSGLLILDSDLTLEAGRAYQVALTITPPAQISGVITESGSWNMPNEEESLNGQTNDDHGGEEQPETPSITPDPNGGGAWNGDEEESLNGQTNDDNTGEEQPETPSITPDPNGGGAWNGDEEETLSGSGGSNPPAPDTNVDPNTGEGGNWENGGDEEPLNGSTQTHQVTPSTGGEETENGSGSWNTEDPDNQEELEGDKKTGK